MEINTNTNKENHGIQTAGQTGGINAQHVTINNNYGKQSKTKFNFNFGTTAGKISIVGIISAGLIYGASMFLSGSAPKTNDEFYDFVSGYFHDLAEGTKNAHDIFADNVSVFYKKKNVTPDLINKYRAESDYVSGEYAIDKASIFSRKAGNITYWRFKSGFICFRPSRKEFEKCSVEMEFGINDGGKITSIEQINVWDLVYEKGKRRW